MLPSCMQKADPVLAAFSVYCEMVANDAKPLAFHYPMAPKDIDSYWSSFESIAFDQGVKIYREDSFSISLLFPEEATKGKSVVLIYKGDRLAQYQQWKNDTDSKKGTMRSRC